MARKIGFLQVLNTFVDKIIEPIKSMTAVFGSQNHFNKVDFVFK